MLNALLSVSWQPELRGYFVVMIMVGVLIGGSYLILGTNVGARLGFLITMTTLAGWMMSMAIIWAVYGIGLKGPDPSWKPAEPVTIVRDGGKLDLADVLEVGPKVDGKSSEDAAMVVNAEMKKEGWTQLDESDPQRGQAVAAADKILQVETGELKAGEYETVAVYDRGGARYPKLGDSIDFLAFKHEPRYAVVEIALLVPQRTEPGRAPARPVVDQAQPHRYVVMIRDLGARRRPAFLIGFGSAIIFFMLAWLLHRRETYLRANLALKA